MSQIVRTRFAPSPTGYMHLGNFRTALYAYLFARKNKGKFIVRIEDTDQNRKVEGAEQIIFRALKWSGLDHDEGPDIGGDFGPYHQSERLDIYKEHIKKLIDKGDAYHCFCTPERLDTMRREAQARGEHVKYDRHCLHLDKEDIQKRIDAGDKYVIRQKVHTTGVTVFEDAVRGKVEIQNKTLDDSVLIKSDGWPTYNFANVIDDHLMGITHVIRGEEYVTSTPKYIQLYNSFGWDIPVHVHLSLILNRDKSKLSKRQGDVALEDYSAKGYLRETIINFVALLGWNPGDDRELFSLDDLVREFDLNKLNKAGAIFDTDKLDWMNGHYIRSKNPEEITELCYPYLENHLKESDISIGIFSKDYIKSVIVLEQERLKTLSEIGDKTFYFFSEPKVDPKKLVWKKSTPEETLDRLDFLIKYLKDVPKENWTRNTLEEALIAEIKEIGYGNGDTLWPMRFALSGEERSPSPFEIAEVLGQDKTLDRLKTAKSVLLDS